MGLVEPGAGGKLYALASPPAFLTPHVSKEARVTGEQFSPAVVMPTKLELKSGGGWKEFPTMPEM